MVGDYVLGKLLGRGGTSEVYAAAHRTRGDRLAIKLLRAELASEPEVIDSFLGEAMRTREIEHPNVVRVLDAGHDAASGACYLVMERIDGGSLAQQLAARGQIAEPELRALCAALADGVAAAHARGIVHRDLKPGNVMMCGDRPTIVDFGLAKSLGKRSAVVTHRRVGTLAYMAPEQLASGLITPAVDIWALGVVMFELATGRLPFETFDDGRLPQLVDAPPRAADLAPISAALSALIARCLERDPGRRPPSMIEIAHALRGDRADGDERVTADLDAGPRVPAPQPRRSRLVRPLLILGLAAAAGAAIAVISAGGGDPAVPSAPAASAAVPAPPAVRAAVPPPIAADPPGPAPEKVTKPARPATRKKPVKTTQPAATSQGEGLD